MRYLSPMGSPARVLLPFASVRVGPTWLGPATVHVGLVHVGSIRFAGILKNKKTKNSVKGIVKTNNHVSVSLFQGLPVLDGVSTLVSGLY